MLDIDLSSYDFIIATPPCNYYSRANRFRETSMYSQKTKHLLPAILKKLQNQDKPFIVENVINKVLMKDIIKDFKYFIYEYGRHTYFTNVPFNPYGIIQVSDMLYKPLKTGKHIGRLAPWSTKKQRQGGINVHNIIEYWLSLCSTL